MLPIIILALLLGLILGPIRHYYKIPDVCSIRDLLKNTSINYLEISSHFFFSFKTVSFYNHLEVVTPKKIVQKMPAQEVKSEMVGTFTWVKTPDGQPTICLGRIVKKDEILGFITALRIPTPVLSPIDGRITGLPIKDNWPVEYGQVVMLIEKNENSLV